MKRTNKLTSLYAIKSFQKHKKKQFYRNKTAFGEKCIS